MILSKEIEIKENKNISPTIYMIAYNSVDPVNFEIGSWLQRRFVFEKAFVRQLWQSRSRVVISRNCFQN